MYRLIKWSLLCALFAVPGTLLSQSLTLDRVNELARKNYPLTKQNDLIRQTAALNISNIAKGYLPQLSFNGQASYQSDVTKVDVPIQGIKIESPANDQYRFTADVNQLIYDGGAMKHQKDLQQVSALAESQQVEVELYKLKDRINQIFLGVLLLDEQIKLIGIIREDMMTGINRVEARLKNGTAFRSDVNSLKAELIGLDQQKRELITARRSLIETLELFTGQPIPEETEFERPVIQVAAQTVISRPELNLYGAQRKIYGEQEKLLNAKNIPRTSLFFQGGYGRPGLNMLNNNFDLFYITGLKFNWSLGGLYTRKNERQLLQLNNDLINVKKDVFLLNTNAELRKQQNEIDKMKDLIEADKQIIELRSSVTQSAKAQLENGVITAGDYTRDVNAESRAKQTLVIHEIQMLGAQLNYTMAAGVK